MIVVGEDDVWRTSRTITTRVIDEITLAMKERERPEGWLAAGDIDLRTFDARSFQRVQDASAETFDFLFTAGPARFGTIEEFLATMFELSRLQLLLALDRRATGEGHGTGPPAEFVLSNVAAALRPYRPSLALITMQARPSRDGLARLGPVQPAEKEELVAILDGLERCIRSAQAATHWPDVMAAGAGVRSALNARPPGTTG